MTNEPEYTPTLFVYIGRGVTEKDVTVGRIISIDLLKRCTTRGEAEGLSSAFAMKERELPRAIGFVYSIKAICDDVGRITNIRGRHDIDGDQLKHGINKEWLAHWQAIGDAKRVEDRARKLHNKYNRDELRDRLKPLTYDWLKTDKIGRLALEVVILDILRSSGP